MRKQIINNINFYFKLIRKHIGLDYYLLLFFIVLGVGMNLSTPFILKKTVELIEQHKVIQDLIMIVSLYVVIWSLSNANESLKEIIFSKISERVIKDLRFLYMKTLYNFSTDTFSEYKTGRLISIIDRARDSFSTILWGVSCFFLPLFFEIFLASIILWKLCSIKYCIILVLTLLCFCLVSAFLNYKAALLKKFANSEENQAVSKITDLLLNIETSKFFNQNRKSLRSLNFYLDRSRAANLVSSIFTNKIGICQSIIVGSGFFSIMIFTILDINKGILKISDFILINGYIIQFFTPLSSFGFILKEVCQSFTNISEFLHILFEEKRREVALRIKLGLEEIKFKNVTVDVSGKRVLDSISCSIKPGKLNIITGRSGSGKSSLLRLIAGFYDIKEGIIMLGKGKISNKACLLNDISVIPQKSIFFNESIEYNLLYGCNKKADNKKIDLLLKLVFLKDLVKTLPQKLKTIIGKGGIELSEGEKQRIGIVRGLLKDASLYIIDEPTTSVDKEMSLKIIDNIISFMRGKTIVMVSHDPDIIIKGEHIIFMRENKVILEK